MADKVAKTGVSKEKGYLYYLGKDGNVWASRMARGNDKGGDKKCVAEPGVTRENGWLYFTKEFFDLLYPSYGDTYPTYLGAIGMTYEQAGGGIAGLGIINSEGKNLKRKLYQVKRPHHD